MLLLSPWPAATAGRLSGAALSLGLPFVTLDAGLLPWGQLIFPSRPWV